MYIGWSNGKVTRLSNGAQILDSLRGGAKYTTPVEFPSCVKSLILHKALRQKRSIKKSWEVYFKRQNVSTQDSTFFKTLK